MNPEAPSKNPSFLTDSLDQVRESLLSLISGILDDIGTSIVREVTGPDDKGVAFVGSSRDFVASNSGDDGCV